MSLPTFGLGSISNTLDNLGFAAELQSLQVALASARDTIDFIADNKLTTANIKTLKKFKDDFGDL